MIGQHARSMRSTLLTLPTAFWTLWAGTLVNRIGTVVLPFLAVYLATARHLSPDRIGLITALPGLAGILAALLMGALADRFERKRLLVLTLFISAALLLPIPLIAAVPMLALAVFAWSIASEVQRPLSMTLVADVVPAEQRRPAVALLRVAINVGTAVSAAWGGLVAAVAFLPLFVADAVTTTLFALLLWARLPAIQREAAPDRPRFRPGLALLPLRDGAFRRLWLASLCGITVYSQLVTTFAVYLIQRGGSAPLYGALMALNGVLIVLVEFPLVTLVNRIATRSAMATGCLIYAGAAGLCALIGAPGWLVLPVLAFTIGEMFFSPAFGAIGADLAPPAQRGAYMGLLWVANGLGFVLGPALGGQLLHISPTLCWGALLVIGLAGAALARTAPVASGATA